MTGLTVENGAAERSYVRDLDMDFNESDCQSGGELTALAGTVGTTGSPDPALQVRPQRRCSEQDGRVALRA